jgi:hypothetical protein
MEAWRLPAPRVMRGVILCGRIEQRLCNVVPTQRGRGGGG